MSSATSSSRSADAGPFLVTDPGPARVVVLADDLIWSTRLAGHVRSAGAAPEPVRTSEAFAAALGRHGAAGAIVDLTSRAYDGLAAIAAARDAGVAVLAVGQHDDHVLRRDALAVGADRVLAYRKLFDDGPATIARWLAAAHPTTEAPSR
jgi:DNA-binding NarL/FixJ family response regulator